MLKSPILNPDLNHLLGRIRHTNTLVICDLGFPFFPQIETVDISLVEGMPTVNDVLQALAPHFKIGRAWMAEEFLKHNSRDESEARVRALQPGAPLEFEPHVEFKRRVPLAIGLVRTGDATQFSNIIIESA